MTPIMVSYKINMSRFEKLIEKFLNLSKDIRFEELCKVLEYYGYEKSQSNSGGSHYVFRKKYKNPITIPKSKNIKKVYVVKVKKVIEEEIKNEKS